MYLQQRQQMTPEWLVSLLLHQSSCKHAQRCPSKSEQGNGCLDIETRRCSPQLRCKSPECDPCLCCMSRLTDIHMNGLVAGSSTTSEEVHCVQQTWLTTVSQISLLATALMRDPSTLRTLTRQARELLKRLSMNFRMLTAQKNNRDIGEKVAPSSDHRDIIILEHSDVHGVASLPGSDSTLRVDCDVLPSSNEPAVFPGNSDVDTAVCTAHGGKVSNSCLPKLKPLTE